MSIPKCTRCNESASWRHDKRRWWCKECKKAFTPGISKMQQVPQQTQLQPITTHAAQMIPNLSGWETPNSSQNTPTTHPQNPNSVTPVSSPLCPSCKGLACWKHDKKRWYCKECKKPFTPISSGISPQSPQSPGKKKSSKSGSGSSGKKSSASSTPASMGSPLTPAAGLQSPLQIQFPTPTYSPNPSLPSLSSNMNMNNNSLIKSDGLLISSLSPPRTPQHPLSNINNTSSILGNNPLNMTTSSLINNPLTSNQYH